MYEYMCTFIFWCVSSLIPIVATLAVALSASTPHAISIIPGMDMTIAVPAIVIIPATPDVAVFIPVVGVIVTTIPVVIYRSPVCSVRSVPAVDGDPMTGGVELAAFLVFEIVEAELVFVFGSIQHVTTCGT